MDECQRTTGASEERAKESERHKLLSESEFEMQRALLEQNIAFPEKTIEGTRQREREHLEELKKTKKDHAQAIRDTTQNYEAQLKVLTAKLEDYEERIADHESRAGRVEAEFEIAREQWEE